jgi:hypothetical protein
VARLAQGGDPTHRSVSGPSLTQLVAARGFSEGHPAIGQFVQQVTAGQAQGLLPVRLPLAGGEVVHTLADCVCCHVTARVSVQGVSWCPPY